jgi:hypothetical protein
MPGEIENFLSQASKSRTKELMELLEKANIEKKYEPSLIS